MANTARPKMVPRMIPSQSGRCNGRMMATSLPRDDVRRRDPLDGCRPSVTHDELEFPSQEDEHGLDALLPERPEAPDVGPADADGRRAQRQRFEDVRPATDAAVEHDRHATSNAGRDLRQTFDGPALAVLGAAAVVGNE